MESQQTHATQSTSQPAFFYYNPDPNADSRQHGHFSPHPNAVQESQQQYQQYIQPGAVMQSQQQMLHSRMPLAGTLLYTPQKQSLIMESPRPVLQRPSFLGQYECQSLSLDTGCSTPDLYVYPSTPPLSASGSASSSPPSTCDILPTPITGSYMNLENIEGVKSGCEGDVQSEILAGEDWTRSCSPQMTPGKSH